MSIPNFEYTTQLLQEIPADMVKIEINSLAHLNGLVAGLVATKHIFLVSPRHQQIAMSQQAFDDLRVLYNA